jgi:hypothetical protein
MASETLDSVVLDVLKNNRRIGKSFVGAYRVGGTRLIRRSPSGKLGERGQKVGDLMIQGIDKASDGANGALDKVYDLAANAIAKTADNDYAAKYFDLVGKVALPSAKLARNLSGKLAARVGKVYRSAGPKAGAKVVKQRRAGRKAAAR